jgi:hypothetical protein
MVIRARRGQSRGRRACLLGLLLTFLAAPGPAQDVIDLAGEWRLRLDRAAALLLDGLPPELRPLVGVIDDHVTNRRLGLLFGARVGQGRLLVSSIDVEPGDGELDPVTRQLRKALFAYAASAAFQLVVEVEVAALRALARPPALLERLGARIRECDSAHADHPPELAIDGDPATIWHSNWELCDDPMLHRLVVDLGSPQTLVGVRLVPRADLSNGRIARTVAFARPSRGRYLELLVTAEVLGRPIASLAELEPVLARCGAPEASP